MCGHEADIIFLCAYIVDQDPLPVFRLQAMRMVFSNDLLCILSICGYHVGQLVECEGMQGIQVSLMIHVLTRLRLHDTQLL